MVDIFVDGWGGPYVVVETEKNICLGLRYNIRSDSKTISIFIKKGTNSTSQKNTNVLDGEIIENKDKKDEL